MSLFRKSYQDHIATEISIDESEPLRPIIRRESATIEFPDGEVKSIPAYIRKHGRTNSSCLVHDLLEVNKLQESTFNTYGSEMSLTKLDNYHGNGKWASKQGKVTPISSEPLSKVALSQLVTSVRDLSQSLSKFFTVLCQKTLKLFQC